MQFIGVEHLAGKRDGEVAKGFAPSILLVSGNGMANVGKMDSDLVCSAGQRLEAQIGGMVEALKNAIAGESFPSLCRCGDHLGSVVAAAGDMRLDDSGFLVRGPDDNGAVFLMDFSGLELLCEAVVRQVVFCRDDATGGILVQPVNNAGAERMAAGGEPLAVSQECVDKRMRRITWRRMDDEAGGLVDHDEVIILKEDVEGDVLGFESGLGRRGKNRFEDVARLDRMVRLDLPAVESDKSLLDQPLRVCPRPVGKLLRKKPIQAIARAGFGYNEA